MLLWLCTRCDLVRPQRASPYRDPFSNHNLSFEYQEERTTASLECSAALLRRCETCMYTCCLQFPGSCSESTRTVRQRTHRAGPHRITIQLWECTVSEDGPYRWEMPAASQRWHSYKNPVRHWRCRWVLGTPRESPTWSQSWWFRRRDLPNSSRARAWHPFCWRYSAIGNSMRLLVAFRLLRTIKAWIWWCWQWWAGPRSRQYQAVGEQQGMAQAPLTWLISEITKRFIYSLLTI